MIWKELDEKLTKFQQDSTVVSQDVAVDTTTMTRPETETVERLIQGKLAVDVRKRLMAPEDAPVVIVEVSQKNWLTDWTSETDYQMTVKCNEVEVEFERYSAHENFKQLLEWLDEEPYEGEY